MRLPYTEDPPKFTSDEDKEILKRVQSRRGERGLLPLDLALLHAPKVADGMLPSYLSCFVAHNLRQQAGILFSVL